MPVKQDFTSQKTILLSRLTKKLGIQFGAIVENLTVPNSITPVTDIDELLRNSKLEHLSLNVYASAQAYWTVPDGKRWTVLYLDKPSTTLGAVNVSIRTRGGTYLLNLFGGTAVGHFQGGPGFTMEPGWYINCTQSANAGDTAVVFALWYKEEDNF